ncbi:MAG: sugar phosphate isomerase/epimerase family protein [Candidatus Latescibacterota bacterium]|jgi:sugar phosphate isomerase/epimerase
MTEPIQNYARIGIVHFMAYKACIGGEGPIVETLEKIATDPYFQVVEVTHMKDATVRAQARDLLKSAHMDVAFGAQPILLGNKYNINSPDANHRKEAIAAVKAGIDQAEELGAPSCALLSGADPGDAAREEGLDLLVDSLNQLCDYAGNKGMGITLETFDRLPFGKNCIIGPNALAVEVSNRLRRQYPNFGLMLDLSHFPLQGESTAYSLNIARDHIVQMHLGNCVMTNPDHPAYGDNHPRFGCEDGENDVPEVVDFLKELLNIGYLDPEKRPILSFEVAPMPGESSEVIIANSKRVLDEAWALV